MNTETLEFIERTVRLRVSRDTMGLWEAMAARLSLTIDELVQVLVMYGAFLLASAYLGHLEGLDLADLTPEALRAVYVPWLEQRTPARAPQPELDRLLSTAHQRCDHPCAMFLEGWPCRCGTPERQS